jgi:hypothetical protein
MESKGVRWRIRKRADDFCDLFFKKQPGMKHLLLNIGEDET